MKNNGFWFVSLCTLLVFANCMEMTLPLRIALAANALVLLIDVAGKIRGYVHGRD